MTHDFGNESDRPAVAETPRAVEDSRGAPVFLMIDKLETGGSERQFVWAAQALRSTDYHVNLGCMRRAGAFLEGLGDISEFNLGGSFISRRAPAVYLALARHLRAQHIAVAHSFDFYSNVMMIPVARASGVPVVIGSQRQLGDLLTREQFAVQSWVLRLCDRVVCNSHAAADRLAAHGVSKLVVIPNGLPDEAFAETAPAFPRLADVLRVGMIARMNHPVKNHPAFLRAAARLAAEFPGAEFLLVGGGPLRPGLERMAASLGLGDRVRFLGDRRDVPAVLAALDVSVLPSHSESLSNAILESMAAGVPVVAARVGGNPEVVIDGVTGLLVPPDDDEQLADALLRLLRQPELRMRYGGQAREFARAHFRPERVRQQYDELYKTLLAEKDRVPTRPASRDGSQLKD